jgi:segregation and condensation protein B
MTDTPRGAPHGGGSPIAGGEQASESGQEHPGLEDRRSSADQDPVSVTDVESEQVSGYPDAEEFEGPDHESADQGLGVEHAEEIDVKEADTTTGPVVSALDIGDLPDPEPQVVRTVEALLFLAPDPLSPQELSDAAAVEELAVIAALVELAERYAPGRSGINLRELGGGFTFASDPETEESARRLFSRPRASVLTPAQAETLAIVAYLQPISRPEITRIRGVSADSAASTLLERGLVEESGRSQFGAVMYRTTTQFLKLFGLKSIEELPDVGQWDPSPDEEAELRDRLLRAGEARAGGGSQPELQ